MNIRRWPHKAIQDTALIVNFRRQEREAIQDFLADADYHVLSANDGDEAMELCRTYQGAIHLLVTDVELADASGWDLAQSAVRIRPGLMVMFVSQETVRAGEPRFSFEGRFTPQVLAEVTQALARKANQNTHYN
jgi:response regulator RpfG family c-di-GMP phosphodiesterase